MAQSVGGSWVSSKRAVRFFLAGPSGEIVPSILYPLALASQEKTSRSKKRKTKKFLGVRNPIPGFPGTKLPLKKTKNRLFFYRMRERNSLVLHTPLGCRP